MKPVPFEYDDPRSLDEALALLAEHGDDAKVLAGGQSLVPLLNFRLVRPARLVDVNRVETLAGIRRSGGALRIGATTREAAVERSAVVAAGWPLLVDAVRHVGHPQIRSRGTAGGSAAHADPAAELPAALTALAARFHVRSAARGARTLEAEEFFRGALTSALAPDELLVEIEVPPLPERTRHGFVELARVDGDYAMAGAAALVTTDEDGRCTSAALTLLSGGAAPRRLREAERILAGARVADAADDAAAAAAEAADPSSDVHVSAEYRRALLRRCVRDALLAAAA